MKNIFSILVLLGFIAASHLDFTEAGSVALSCTGIVHGFNGSNSEIGVSQGHAGQGGATRQKNRAKGPADLGIYYINSAGVSCGGMKTAQCSTSCGSLGYPVYWCYPKVCYCHYGNSDQDENDVDYQVPELFN